MNPSHPLRALALGLLVLFHGVAGAQAYPSKPIRIIAPVPPGGSNDLLARLLADKLKGVLGVSVIVENRPGASGGTGVRYLLDQKPDGYTLLMANNAIAIDPLLREVAYDPVSDFAPIAVIGKIVVMIGGRPSLPVKNMAELVAYAKANPGKLTYASCGTGTVPHLAGEVFKQRTGIDMTHVPYKGCGDSIANVIGGQVDVTFSTIPALLSVVQAGRIKGYATAGEKREVLSQELPTVAESGYPGYSFALWHGLVAAKGTPVAIVDRLNAAVNQALRDEDLLKQFAAQHIQPGGGTPADFAERIRTDIKVYGDVIRKAKITLE